ncbi:MAG: hypothetical protein NWQ54_14625 [Paraglaciecola sp.]|uniref:hypothetical protein n=1 Tax=Paraglaciecola sp. TaxID=1920173 RepID=UPI00273F7E4A|nr:hypothetical protein [Paraglaciecola sp.]MDP5031155.1 hypothetical protein [Paraglaciecola sp.]MDP5041573.1 hypothetical protein [Paraglaciecola sp.]MDP5132116.1 hypothetical protein [Paraglaciecola sp.]
MKIKYFSFPTLIIFSGILSVFSCTKTDQHTIERINYWDKQAEIMILVGPDKTKVFEWVYALDKEATYTGDELHANVEKLLPDNQRPQCIRLSIEFDENDRVKDHVVTLVKDCTP